MPAKKESIHMSETERDIAENNPLRELLQKVSLGDRSAANQLLGEIRPDLKEEVNKLGRSKAQRVEDASDVAQKCLLAIWKHAGEVHGATDGEVRAWLKAIVRNELFSTVKYEQRQMRDVRQQVPLPLDSSGGVALAADTSTRSQQVTRREEHERRERALSQLSPDDQQVIRLRYAEGRSWRDIAQQMARGEETVKRLYYRAVKRWKKRWEPSHDR
jgi:RNA polymerase sigma-70 factor (ECF subfamily)